MKENQIWQPSSKRVEMPTTGHRMSHCGTCNHMHVVHATSVS